jgi:hypothetical protein
MPLPSRIPFVQAQWYTPIKRARHVQYIVLHSMEAPEKGDTAENIAQYFAKGVPANRKASAHYCIDGNSVIQCVQTRDVAYAAPGANHNGIQIEMAGYARQAEADWKDPYSWGMLTITAELCAKVLMPKYDIPPTFRNAASLATADRADDTGHRGFTTHAEVSKAFRQSSHWDPGPGFPMRDFLGLVERFRV